MIGVDWGTSRFRAYRIEEGEVIARREADCGAATLGREDFAPTLLREIDGWLQEDRGPIVLAGMVGSRQGWHEAPYLACPADAAAIAGATLPVALPGGRSAHIVPGLTCRDGDGFPDVLRGEETQIMGLLPHLPAGGAHLVCLPGTHSKWVRVVEGRIQGFATHMTGEMFDLVLNRSMVGRMAGEAGAAAATDDRAFAAGVARARQEGGLLHHLFSIRAAALVGDLAPAAVRPFLSGLLIGHEIFTVAPPSTVHLLGGAALAEAYDQALAVAGCRAVRHDADLAADGLWRIGSALAGV